MRNAFVAFLTLSLPAVPGLAQEGTDGGKVVAYVSFDEENARPILAEFTKETGIEVDAHYDTEATKTVALTRQLVEQKNDPQADVFWNNELATMIKLKEDGVLQKCDVPEAKDIPANFKDPDGMWIGFAARARVLIVNTDLVTKDEMPTSMWDLTDPKWRGRICMARPVTGTTAAHAVALYVKDPKMADDYFNRLADNDCHWLTGNGYCMRDVAAGRFAFGWTDTDDFNVAREQGKHVAIVYPDSGPDQIGVIYIPNTLGLIRGAKHAENGRKLISWLLRPEMEKQLAEGRTAQIPVRPNIPVPAHVRRPDQVGKVFDVDWGRVGKEYDKWVAHVKELLAAKEESSSTLLWVVAVVVVIAVGTVLVLKRATSEPA